MREHDDEVPEVPVMPMAEAKHRPPALTAGEEEKRSPQMHRPEWPDARTREEASANADQNLGHRQAIMIERRTER